MNVRRRPNDGVFLPAELAALMDEEATHALHKYSFSACRQPKRSALIVFSPRDDIIHHVELKKRFAQIFTALTRSDGKPWLKATNPAH